MSSRGYFARTGSLLALALALLVPASAGAEALRDRFSGGGYFRISTRPDFRQGGNSRLGYWNLYGRLLNEGSWGTMALKLDLLQNPAGRAEPWARVLTQIEGGSFFNADAGRGALSNFGVTRLYVEAGNVLGENLTFQFGTLEQRFGDLGLYDMWPAEIFWDTVGVLARYDNKKVELVFGVGDAGYNQRGGEYSTILSAGGLARVRVSPRFELGLGGQVRHEPEVSGNRNAPYSTPGVRYEDYKRGEVAQRWVEEHPGQELLFPNPVAQSSSSYKAIAYAGFGGVGPLRWNNLFANFMRLHPKNYTTEQYNGRSYTVFIRDLTDERYQWNVGNEMQVGIIEDKLDATWSMVFGHHYDLDNTVAAGDDNRTFYSTVLRLQYYVTKTVHLLGESSVAREISDNGRLYREHADSIFRNTDGVPDARGFENGDTDTRNTWQLKTGLVLNPNGRGIFTRPSLRLLYGLQYSNTQASFGNGFVESQDQYNVFQGPERHWHSVFAIEAEAWF